MVTEVTDWLLDADPAIRWQVSRDLTDATRQQVATERTRVAEEGWGARLLGLQGEDGQWGGGSYTPKWTSTTYTLLPLRHLGIDANDERMRAATGRVADGVFMRGDRPFFDYATEVCRTGMTLALGSYFLSDVDGLSQPEYLLERQRDDGGWNCQVSSPRRLV